MVPFDRSRQELSLPIRLFRLLLDSARRFRPQGQLAWISFPPYFVTLRPPMLWPAPVTWSGRPEGGLTAADRALLLNPRRALEGETDCFVELARRCDSARHRAAAVEETPTKTPLLKCFIVGATTRSRPRTNGIWPRWTLHFGHTLVSAKKESAKL
jgi:hypothetical protein